ncbi:ABC transporter permease [Paenibacillus sp. HN-1]|uniref:ABC transporter permease n=1 Tax=Paenibacillus TaxID=44249 RepID=UPI001CA7CF47|nr:MULTISPECIES: ABC transporter permease [Paenibacillus]MBY9080898.1 ABC transporter permease [Paenibacillus sp. CGMCC 1.18879]MBY9085110.1 ABC transporter permease [Paenibacillus sinensis]
MKLWHLAALLLLFSAGSLFIGIKDISPLDLFSLTDSQRQVLMVSRIPRLMALIVAGMSMSIAGLIMQQLSRNKFVSPTTAGTMDSAKFGIMVALMFFSGASAMQKLLVAFVFSLLGTFLFMRILERIKYKDSVFIPLVGLMFGNIVGSVTTFFAYKNDLVQNISSWMMGDFSSVLKGNYELIYISVPLLLLAYAFANRFTVAGMGEDFAVNLGLNYKAVVNIGLVIVALTSSVVLLTAGMIPFLGLVVPNIVSLYIGDHLKKSLAHTALLGAVFLLFCDILGRIVIYPYEVSISLTVGVIGSGLFIYLLLRSRKGVAA